MRVQFSNVRADGLGRAAPLQGHGVTVSRRIIRPSLARQCVRQPARAATTADFARTIAASSLGVSFAVSADCANRTTPFALTANTA